MLSRDERMKELWAHLRLHWNGIDLTHVESPVVLRDAGDMQIEGGEQIPGDRDAWIMRNDRIVDSLNGLRVGLHPPNLWTDQHLYCTHWL